MLRRYFFRKSMRSNPIGDMEYGPHPATDAVRNHLDGPCTVVWGLKASCTLLCAHNIARGIIRENGIAKIFRCDKTPSLRTAVLNECRTWDEFASWLSERRSWLIFDTVTPGALPFVRELLRLADGRFKLLLFVHEADTVCSILRWGSTALVEPVGCCKWDVYGGCPNIQTPAQADELEARWGLNTRRLERFIRDEWSPDGAVRAATCA